MKSLLLVFAILLSVSCGSDPVPLAPTPPSPASVSGNWSGTVEGSQPVTGAFLTAIVLNLTQAEANVSGTWVISNANGTVSGTTTPNSFSGTFTWNATATNGTPCAGTFAVSGPAGGNTLTWTSPAITGSCTNLPTGITIAVQRR